MSFIINPFAFATGTTLWTPANITTHLWIDASDTSSITESTNLVSQINDKSGNGFHLTQSNDSNKFLTNTRTQNSLNVLDGDDTDYMQNTSFSIPSSGDIMFIMVFGVDVVGDGKDGAIVCTGTTGFDYRASINSYFKGEISTNGIGSNSVASDVNRNAFGIHGVVLDFNTTGYYNAYYNGTVITSDTTYTTKLNSSTFGLAYSLDGTNRQFDGFYGEIVATEDVTVATRQKIEGYLAHKWGTTASLPAGHPYKSNAPTV